MPHCKKQDAIPAFIIVLLSKFITSQLCFICRLKVYLKCGEEQKYKRSSNIKYPTEVMHKLQQSVQLLSADDPFTSTRTTAVVYISETVTLIVKKRMEDTMSPS